MTTVITGYARTPFARYAGALAAVPAVELGACAVRAALARAGVAPGAVDHVLGGQVLQTGCGQNPARQAAVAAGIPLTVPAVTLNAVCLSGMLAVAGGADLIGAGRAEVVVAFGQESMSLAPHAWSGSRQGTRYGPVELLDTMDHDGLTDAFEGRSMGASTEAGNGERGLTRREQDEWALASHRRAAAARDLLAAEIVPVEVPARRGTTTVAQDDGVRPDTSLETLAGLPAPFGGAGTITAGSASQITDGAAALVLMSERAARAAGARPLARILGQGFVAGPGVSLHDQPADAILAALADAGRSLDDLRAVEVNEAFAAVAVRSTHRLGVDPDLVNSNGGAIALGHPIGASGARITGHLARRLADLGDGAVGAAGICGGGGQGAALVLQAAR